MARTPRDSQTTSAAPLSQRDTHEEEVLQALQEFSPESHPLSPRARRRATIFAVVVGVLGVTVVAWLGYVLGGWPMVWLALGAGAIIFLVRAAPVLVAGWFRRRDRQRAERMVQERHRRSIPGRPAPA